MLALLFIASASASIGITLLNDVSYPTSTKADAAVVTVPRPALRLYYGDNLASSVLLGISGREADVWAMESGCAECFTALNIPNTSTEAFPAYVASSTAYESESGSAGFKGTLSKLSLDSQTLTDVSVGVMNEIIQQATDVVAVQGTSGIFGLAMTGLSGLNKTSILSQFVSASSEPTAAMAFAPDNAYFEVGPLDTSKYTGSIQWVPTVSTSAHWTDATMGYWIFQVSGMGFDDAQFSIGSGGSPLLAAIDPSSPFVFVPEQLAVALYKAAGFNFSRPSAPRTTDPGFFYVPCSQPTSHVFKIVISKLKYSFSYQALPLSYGTQDDQLFNQGGVCIGNLASTNYNPYGEAANLDNPSMILGMPFLQTVVTVMRYQTDDCLPQSLGFAPVVTSSNLTIGRAADTTGNFSTNTVTALPSSLCTPLALRASSSGSGHSKIGLIIGLCVAGVAIIAAIAAILWIRHLHKNKHLHGYQPNNKDNDSLPAPKGSSTDLRSPAFVPAALPSRSQSPATWNEKPGYRYSPHDEAALLELQSRMDDKTKQNAMPPRHSEVSAASSFGSPSMQMASSGISRNEDPDEALKFTPSIFTQNAGDARSVAASTIVDGRNSAMTRHSFYARDHTSVAPSMDESLRPETYYDPFDGDRSVGVSRAPTYTSVRSGLTGISMNLSEVPPMPQTMRGQQVYSMTTATDGPTRAPTYIEPSPALRSAGVEEIDDGDDDIPSYMFRTSQSTFTGTHNDTNTQSNRDSDWI